MLIALINRMFLWSIYFLFYRLILFRLISLVNFYNIASISQNSFSVSSISQASLFLTLFSFGGLPPFSGFIPKWLVVSQIRNSPVIMTILVTSSLLTLFFYLRIATRSLLLKSPILPVGFVKQEDSLIPSCCIMLNTLGLLATPTLFLT